MGEKSVQKPSGSIKINGKIFPSKKRESFLSPGL
jgi:hypothetical protein